MVLNPFNIHGRIVETFFTALQVLHKYKYRLCTELLHTVVFGLQKGEPKKEIHHLINLSALQRAEGMDQPTIIRCGKRL